MKKFKDYPVKISQNAQEGYIFNLEKKICNNATGVTTAIKLINRSELDFELIKKINSYLKRAKVYVGDIDKCGYISYQLWGGNEMLEWSNKILKQTK
jgi:hypothetical protein